MFGHFCGHLKNNEQNANTLMAPLESSIFDRQTSMLIEMFILKSSKLERFKLEPSWNFQVSNQLANWTIALGSASWTSWSLQQAVIRSATSWNANLVRQLRSVTLTNNFDRLGLPTSYKLRTNFDDIMSYVAKWVVTDLQIGSIISPHLVISMARLAAKLDVDQHYSVSGERGWTTKIDFRI